MSLGVQSAVDVVVGPPTDNGGSVVISYRVVGVPTGGGANITVSGFGVDVAGGKVNRRGRWGAERSLSATALHARLQPGRQEPCAYWRLHGHAKVH